MKAKRALSFALMLVMLAALLCPVSYAAEQKFTDVKASHWAFNTINVIADGGLVVGYPDGSFGPSTSISRAELATIVARIKGYDAEAYGRVSDSTYWAYEALDYCVNVAQCMPSFGDITPENYNVPCTRELAASVLVKGIGSNNPDKYNPNIKAEDIPDLYKVGWSYQNDVLKAYQLGLVNGMDDKGTFEPQGEFTRAQVATMLINSGFTTAADKPEGEASKTLAEAFEEIKAMGVWGEPTYSYETIVDPDTGEVSETDKLAFIYLYGKNEALGIIISYQQELSEYMPECLHIGLAETPTSVYQWGMKDFNGNPFTYDEVSSGSYRYKDTGLYALPSGYHYNTRQVVKQILGIVLPAAEDDAYTALKEVMLQEVYEPAYSPLTYGIATASRWLDGHYVQITFDDPGNSVFIDIYTENDKGIYLKAMSRPLPGYQLKYSSACTADTETFSDEFIAAFELDRW